MCSDLEEAFAPLQLCWKRIERNARQRRHHSSNPQMDAIDNLRDVDFEHQLILRHHATHAITSKWEYANGRGQEHNHHYDP